MSHRKERQEKICLNCQTQTVGRFCHVCGQENVEPKESFLHLLRHFIEDLTHFDGKFFKTLVFLFTKPGYLTIEYQKGRRAEYLNPIRFYIFVSAFFFLLLLSVFMHLERPSLGKKETSTLGKAMTDFGSRLKKINSPQANNNRDYQTVSQYDSIQQLLPEDERDGAMGQYFIRKALSGQEYAATHKKESNKKWSEKFFHSLPYALFITLPFVALLLQLLYWRHKEYYYTSHIIFMIHIYCFVFLLLLLTMTIMRFGAPGYFIANLLRLSIFVYLFMAMRRFYGQNFWKTFIKFILFSVSALSIVVLFSFIVAINTFLNLAP